METGQERSATAGAEHLAALMVGLRAGESTSMEALCLLLLPGVQLLIQRRTGRRNVDAEAKSLLVAACASILGQSGLGAASVPETVRKMIHETYPQASGRTSQTDGVITAERGMKIAKKILKRMPAAVQDALRRSYVLGEPPETILADLGLAPEYLRTAKSKARAEFASKIRQPQASAD